MRFSESYVAIIKHTLLLAPYYSELSPTDAELSGLLNTSSRLMSERFHSVNPKVVNDIQTRSTIEQSFYAIGEELMHHRELSKFTAICNDTNNKAGDRVINVRLIFSTAISRNLEWKFTL